MTTITPARLILVLGFDFSQESLRALRNSLWRTQNDDAEVHLVHSLGYSDYLQVEGDTIMERQDNALEQVPKAITELLRETGMLTPEGERQRIFVHVRIEEPVQALIEAAAEFKANAIVVGTHGRRGVQRILLGSVAEQLVRTAPCPVWVEREADYSKVRQREKLLPPTELASSPDGTRWTYRPVGSTQLETWASRNVSTLGPTF